MNPTETQKQRNPLSYKNKPDPLAKRDRQAAFLEAYEKCGTVTEACEHIGISRSAVQRWRQEPGLGYDRVKG